MLVLCLSEGEFMLDSNEELKLMSNVAVKNQCPRRKVYLRLPPRFPPLPLLCSLRPRRHLRQMVFHLP